MRYYDDGRIVIKSWCDAPEEGALFQARNIANLPFAYHHIALMPDTHQGYGMPIGGVCTTLNYVVPNMVGVDIGCGMCAVKTPYLVSGIDISTLKSILGKIRETVPVGFKKNTKVTALINYKHYPVTSYEYKNAMLSLGSLGGGNHFMELQKDSDDYIWIMIHSGSRNLGKKVCDHYNKIAIDLNEKYFSSVTKDKQLAFLPADSPEGVSYINEMNFCVYYAKENRKEIMRRIINCFPSSSGINIDSAIDVAHNYARLEHHFGKNVWVHRKGATSAKLGEIGIIPGSQGTSSYIVEGLGNKESFMSCSHGAGRRMGRKEAQRTLSLEEEQNKLDKKGILHAIRGLDDLDEASGAYKAIETVMEEQKDLVKIITKLEPIAVIKG